MICKKSEEGIGSSVWQQRGGKKRDAKPKAELNNSGGGGGGGSECGTVHTNCVVQY